MNKDYFWWTVISMGLVLGLDWKLGTNLVKRRIFWIFQIIIIGVTSIVDNFISGRAVHYDTARLLGVMVGNTPLENYIFGFSLLTLNLILFELWQKRKLS